MTDSAGVGASLTIPGRIYSLAARASFPAPKARQRIDPGVSPGNRTCRDCFRQGGDGDIGYVPNPKSADSFVLPQLRLKAPPLAASFRSMVNVSTGLDKVSDFNSVL